MGWTRKENLIISRLIPREKIMDLNNEYISCSDVNGDDCGISINEEEGILYMDLLKNDNIQRLYFGKTDANYLLLKLQEVLKFLNK